MAPLAALSAGLLFGLGLIVSGMIDPLKVQNFLDLFGAFDPSLAFVMAGAIAVALPGFALARRRLRPLFAQGFRWPDRSDIDRRLLGGASLFGIGWGLTGYCPGPAITAISLAAPGTLVFVASMVAGFYLSRIIPPRAVLPPAEGRA